jgi:hypothetical protein
MCHRIPTLFTALALTLPASADVLSIDILERVPFADGKSFGAVGQYELIRGIVRYGMDPKAEANRKVVDLELAATNAKGLVECETDLVILAPRDMAKGNGAILYDVNNRGRKLALGLFNTPVTGSRDEHGKDEGNGFLMKKGYTVVWSGWIGELLSGEGRLLMKAPRVPVKGLARFEFSTDVKAASLPISRREGHGSYPPSSEGERSAVMTMRLREQDPPKIIPRDKWKLVQMPIAKVKDGVEGTLPQIRAELDGGFQPGVLYEIIYEAEGSLVQGLGLASVRDLISFLRYDTSKMNPLRRSDGLTPITRAHGFGISQSGRFLRHFLYQGFNIDAKGRIVFDGLIPHVAGGGLGFFNHRFAQPTRHNGQHEDHLYPCDIFPFTYGPSVDPFTGRSDSILKVYEKSRCLPKVMHTQSAAEYWHRSGSLVHTDPLAKEDAVIPDNVRIYAFGGTQHGPAVDPPVMSFGQTLPNPGDFRPFMRALLESLDDWVRIGRMPPPSVYPRLAGQRTLYLPEDVQRRFPAIPDIRFPTVIQQPPFASYGEDFHSHFRVTQEPPKRLGEYVVMVPMCDEDGNDLGCLMLPDIRVPLATYTGWNLRRKEVGAENMLASLLGSYIPFARTAEERLKARDPRKSIEERYGSFSDYRIAYFRECQRLVENRYLLEDDLSHLIESRARFRNLFPKTND